MTEGLLEKGDRMLLDTSGFLAFLWAEAGGKRVREAVLLARKGVADLALSEMSLAEAFSVVGRKRGQTATDQTLRLVRSLPLRLVPCPLDLLLDAARLRIRHGLHFADCVVAATALRENRTVWTCDPDFRELAGEVRVVFLR
jgi:predicted nucleic acid-binding protein